MLPIPPHRKAAQRYTNKGLLIPESEESINQDAIIFSFKFKIFPNTNHYIILTNDSSFLLLEDKVFDET